ncbi:MAG: hypothetical protein WB660_00400, partial [Candidatus Sulfotelmatobacter sp.]
MPRDAEIVKNNPPLLDNFAVQRADGADLALRFYQMVAFDGPMPAGGTNRVEIAVCSIPALLAMNEISERNPRFLIWVSELYNNFCRFAWSRT